MRWPLSARAIALLGAAKRRQVSRYCRNLRRLTLDWGEARTQRGGGYR
jgi:hypothetical protein